MARKFYRKRPVEVEAVEWRGDNYDEIARFVGDGQYLHGPQLLIQTLEGMMRAQVGDFIVKGVEGEFYPCKGEIFKKTYELVRVEED